MMYYPLQTRAEADNFQRGKMPCKQAKQILNGSNAALGGYYFNFSQTSVTKVTLPVGNHASIRGAQMKLGLIGGRSADINGSD